MSTLSSIFQMVLLIIVVLTLFNLIIFVHELGHFLAARWRGLKVDRFQIWFGKPIWKKEINGVQYGLGSIPAGGFVALPQMAPMEAIEGGDRPSEPLPPISAMDKIIVAFAGPLFSLLLGLAAAGVVWQIGKPRDLVTTQTIGFVEPGGEAQKAGLLPGDTIIAINGKPVKGFAGSLESIKESIVLSSTEKIEFLVRREGHDEPIRILSDFKIPDTKWHQRGGLRQVGISFSSPLVIHKVLPHSPAADAGLKEGDRILSADGHKLYSDLHLRSYLKEKKWAAVRLAISDKNGATRELEITPEKPKQPKQADPALGIVWDFTTEIDTQIIKPGPIEQVGDSLRMMWVTLSSLLNKNSSVDISHLSGPVGIGSLMYDLMQTENGWRRIIAFLVIFNVNLAVLNMLPFPVLDGGHITLAILEKIAGRPVKAKPLEIMQTLCAVALISLMLYVTSKDIADRIGGGGGGSGKVVFPE